MLFLLDEFGSTFVVEEVGVNSVNVGDIEDLVEAQLGEFFLTDTTDTVGAVDNNLLFVVF